MAPIEQKIRTFYQCILQRPAEPGEVAHWMSQAAAGTSLSDIADAVMRSPEARELVVPIVQLYRIALGRRPDPVGLDHWVHHFRAGVSLDAIAEFFLSSSQSVLDGEATSLEALVHRLHRRAFGRNGSAEEVAAWLGKDLSRGQLLAALATAPEALEFWAAATNDFLVAAGNGAFLVQTGNSFREAGDFAGSLAAYRTAERLEPDNAEIHFQLGRLHREAGNLSSALDSYRRAAALDPYSREIADGLKAMSEGVKSSNPRWPLPVGAFSSVDELLRALRNLPREDDPFRVYFRAMGAPMAFD